MAKLVVIALDWWLGYWLYMRPRCVRGIWVFLDRHYLLDVQVDPLRYRYGGPSWLPRFLARILPGPKHVILLDAPVELLQARKPEVSRAEAARQRDAYLALVRRLPRSHIVDASQTPEQVAAQVESIMTTDILIEPSSTGAKHEN